MKKPSKHIPWAVLLLAAPAFVAIWSGWVGLGRMAGFGPVNLLPGIGNGLTLDTSITLPIGMETYAAYALKVWLDHHVTGRAKTFAKWSALTSLAIGSLGQVAYHLLAATGATSAPLPVVIVVACIPVAVLGMGAALAHLVRAEPEVAEESEAELPVRMEAEVERELPVDELPEPEVVPAPAPELPPVMHPELPAAPTRKTAAATNRRSTANLTVVGKVARRTPEETCAAFDALLAAEPRLTKQQCAERLGITDRALRNALSTRKEAS